jgi:hypothetical protein
MRMILKRAMRKSINRAPPRIDARIISAPVTVMYKKVEGDGIDQRKSVTSKVDFDWKDFLKPSISKIGITLLLPAITAALVTRRMESIFDFYGYLITPRMSMWNGSEIVYVFNRYTLLWIPFYLAACIFTYVYMRMSTQWLYNER